MIWIDAIDGKRCLFHIGTFERLDVVAIGLAPDQLAAVIKSDDNCRDLQQRIGFAIEAASFDINNNWQKTAKAVGHFYPCVHLTYRLVNLLVEKQTHGIADAKSRRFRGNVPEAAVIVAGA